MNILALDLALRVGWAAMIEGELTSGTEPFMKDNAESRGVLFMCFTQWLGRMALHPSTGTPRVDAIVYEGAHHRGRAATEIALGLAAHVQSFAAAHGLPEPASVHTATLKKFVTGNGHALKEQMVKAVSGRWKVVTDEDEADAIAVLYHALEGGR